MKFLFLVGSALKHFQEDIDRLKKNKKIFLKKKQICF